MAKIVKKKRRRLSFNGIAIVLFTIALISWLLTSLLVNTVNTSLTMKIQSLENKDRVFEVAQAADLDQLADNIISVGD